MNLHSGPTASDVLAMEFFEALESLTAFCELLLWLVSKGRSIVFEKYIKSDMD
jgi:hypothetical protein